MCCILGGSLPCSVLASVLLGKQLCGFCSLNPYLELPSFLRGFSCTAGKCESPFVVPLFDLFFYFNFLKIYCSVYNMQRPLLASTCGAQFTFAIAIFGLTEEMSVPHSMR